MTNRIILFVAGTLIGVALLLGGLWAYRTYVAAPPLRGVAIESPRPAYDFELLSAGDQAIRLSDYKGKVVVLYFGYTFCPDVCPKTLSDLTLALKEIGAEADGVQVVFVSIDPERDTPTRTDEYAKAFNPTFVGATGSPDAIARVAGAYGVFYQRQETPNSGAGYLMDHSATVQVVDRQGQLRTLWPFDFPREDIVNDLRSLLR